MTLFLDSALVEDARRADKLGFVTGITTNPALIAQMMEAGLYRQAPLQHTVEAINDLCSVFSGVVMAQLTSVNPADREAEGYRLLEIHHGQVGLKIPSTTKNFVLARRFSSEGYIVGMTTIFSPEQVYLACEAGVKYIFPYVNRSTRLLGDGLALVRQMRAVVDALKSPVHILAASIKTPKEAVDTILAGAHGLTLPFDVMLSMGQHPLSDQSIAEFNQS